MLAQEQVFFIKFKNLYDKLMINYDAESITQLRTLIETADTNLLGLSKKAIMVPLMIGMQRRDLAPDCRLHILHSVLKVLNASSEIKSANEAVKLYTLVFDQITTDNNLTTPTSLEELKESVLMVASSVITEMHSSALYDTFTPAFAPQISYGVFLALEMAKLEKKKQIRIFALQFLLTLSQYESATILNDDFEERVADFLKLFLPGLVSGLKEIICRDEKQHHEIVQMAVRCLGHILGLVLKDNPSKDGSHLKDKEIVSNWSSSVKKDETLDDTKKILQGKERSRKWAQTATKALEPSLLSIFDKRFHSHPHVRLEFVVAMNNLLEKCTCNMGNSIAFVFEVLISLADDADECVREKAQFYVNKFKEKHSESDKKSEVLKVITDNFHVLLNTLIKKVPTYDENMILTSIKLLRGYIDFHTNSNSLQSPVYIRKIIYLLQICYKFELGPYVLLLDCQKNEEALTRNWKQFTHFQSNLVTDELDKLIITLLKNVNNAEVIFDCLLEEFAGKSYKLETLNLINCIIAAWENPSDRQIKNMLEFYLLLNSSEALTVWRSEERSLKEKKEDLVQEALIVEGIGKISIAAKEKFSDFLLKTLYIVTEKMGSNYFIIKTSAFQAATKISEACGYASVSNLIQHNIDYLSYHVTFKLKDDNQRAFSIVSIIMENSPAEALINLQDIVEKILESSCENFNNSTTISYLRIFRTFVDYVLREFPESVQVETLKPITCFQTLKEFILKREKIKAELEREDELNTNEEEDKKMEPPRYVQLTVTVVRRCLHYLPSKSDERKILALEVLDRGLRIIASWENELLPLVHEIWHPLVRRFDSDVNPLLMNRSFQLLCTMADLAKDFIRRRTLKEVLPSIKAFLIKSATQSKGKDSGSGYFITQQFKLQRELLSHLGQLVIDLQLDERECDSILESAMPYLSSLQPKPLNAASVELHKKIFEHNPTLVDYCLSPFDEEPEYKKNVLIILNR